MDSLGVGSAFGYGGDSDKGHGEEGGEVIDVRAGADLPDINALYVRHEFANADAVGFHLGTTAGAHFPDLLAIATPGPFFFMGDVPEEMKQATAQMHLGAEFASHTASFDR